ncbi:MAG: hypothetical protein KF900_03985 [Bacteroidetes bacterium]|nr:hypothetical protein [Bacteroidota bacterium]
MIIIDWIEKKNALVKTLELKVIQHISEKTENDIFHRIDIENKLVLGSIILYENGYLHIDIHDKVNIFPLLVKSFKTECKDDIVKILETHLEPILLIS